jgi:alpha-L-fucosidase 2
VRHRRELFCSEPDQVLVMQFEAQGGTFDLDLGYRHPAMAEFYGAKAIDPRTSAVRMQGAAWDFREPPQKDKRPAGLEIRPDGDDALLITGSNIGDAGIPAGLRYALRVQLLGNGYIHATGDRVQVRGSGKLMLLIAGATSFVRYDDVSGDPVRQVRERTAAAARRSHADLKQRHLRAHQAIFRRVALQLGAPADDARPTNERIFQVAERPTPRWPPCMFSTRVICCWPRRARAASRQPCRAAGTKATTGRGAASTRSTSTPR